MRQRDQLLYERVVAGANDFHSDQLQTLALAGIAGPLLPVTLAIA